MEGTSFNFSKEVGMVVTAVGLIIAVIIGLIVFTPFTGVDTEELQETYDVDDPSVDQGCDIPGYAYSQGVVSVEYNNGTGYVTLTANVDYVISSTTVTVYAAAMD